MASPFDTPDFDIEKFRSKQSDPYWRSQTYDTIAQDVYRQTPELQQKYATPDEWINTQKWAPSVAKEREQQAALAQQQQAEQNRQQMGDVERGLYRGLHQVAGLGGGLTALAGGAISDLTGGEYGQGMQDWGMQAYKERQEKAAMYPGTTLKEIEGAGSAIDWAQGVLGEQLPMMAFGGVSGFVGKKIGQKIATEGLKRYARDRIIKEGLKSEIAAMTAGEVGKGLGRKELRALASQRLSDQLAAKADDALAQIISNRVGEAGFKAGVAAGMTGLEGGGMYAEAFEREKVKENASPWTALLLGAAAGTIEILGGNFLVIEKLLGGTLGKSIKGALKRGKIDAAKAGLAEIFKNAGTEFSQEAAQEVLAIVNVAANDPEFNRKDPENLWRVFESGMAGAVMGVAGGSPGAAYAYTKTRDQKADPRETISAAERTAAKYLPQDPIDKLANQFEEFVQTGVMPKMDSGLLEAGDAARMDAQMAAPRPEQSRPAFPPRVTPPATPPPVTPPPPPMFEGGKPLKTADARQARIEELAPQEDLPLETITRARKSRNQAEIKKAFATEDAEEAAAELTGKRKAETAAATAELEKARAKDREARFHEERQRPQPKEPLAPIQEESAELGVFMEEADSKKIDLPGEATARWTKRLKEEMDALSAPSRRRIERLQSSATGKTKDFEQAFAGERAEAIKATDERKQRGPALEPWEFSEVLARSAEAGRKLKEADSPLRGVKLPPAERKRLEEQSAIWNRFIEKPKPGQTKDEAFGERLASLRKDIVAQVEQNRSRAELMRNAAFGDEKFEAYLQGVKKSQQTAPQAATRALPDADIDALLKANKTRKRMINQGITAAQVNDYLRKELSTTSLSDEDISSFVAARTKADKEYAPREARATAPQVDQTFLQRVRGMVSKERRKLAKERSPDGLQTEGKTQTETAVTPETVSVAAPTPATPAPKPTKETILTKAREQQGDQPQAGVSIPDLRKEFPGATKEEFDKILMDVATAGDITLQGHILPADYTALGNNLDDLATDGKNYFGLFGFRGETADTDTQGKKYYKIDDTVRRYAKEHQAKRAAGVNNQNDKKNTYAPEKVGDRWQLRVEPKKETPAPAPTVSDRKYKPSGMDVDAVDPPIGPSTYAWRVMTKKQLDNLLSGESFYGGDPNFGKARPKRGEYFSNNVAGAAEYAADQYTKARKYLVEFADVGEVGGETIKNRVGLENVTKIWVRTDLKGPKNDPDTWADFPIDQKAAPKAAPKPKVKTKAAGEAKLATTKDETRRGVVKTPSGSDRIFKTAATAKKYIEKENLETAWVSTDNKGDSRVEFIDKDISPKGIAGDKGAAGLASGKKVEFQYRLIEAEDLIPSHNSDFREQPEDVYPAVMQPRGEDRKNSGELIKQVQRYKRELDPTYLGQAPTFTDGAPLTGIDMRVESGNGRAMAVILAHKDNKSPIKGYVENLKDKAGTFGFKKEDIEQLKQPVLIRVRLTPMDRIETAEQGNVSMSMATSDTQIAKSDARKILSDPNIAKVYNVDQVASVNAASNRQFVQRFLGTLSPSERANMRRDDLNLTDMGVARVERAVFQAAYQDDLLSKRQAEGGEDGLNIFRALTTSIKDFLPARANTKDPKMLGLIDTLTDAVKVWYNNNKYQSDITGKTGINAFFEDKDIQNEMFEAPIPPTVKKLALAIQDKVRSSFQLTKLFTAIANDIKEKSGPHPIKDKDYSPDAVIARAIEGVAPQEELSLFQATLTAEGSGITKADVKRIFKKLASQVKQNKDGTFRILVGNKWLTLQEVESIDFDKAAFKLSRKRDPLPGERPIATYKSDTITFTKDAQGSFTLGHEVFHFLKDSGFIDGTQYGALQRRVSKEMGTAAADVTEEDISDWVGKNLTNRAIAREKGLVRRLLQMLKDLMDGFTELFNSQLSGQKVLRDIESGRVARKAEGVRGVADRGMPQYAAADEAGANASEIADAMKEWAEKGTDSKYFKRWFGDSKVVDAKGKPLVVYHGTPFGNFADRAKSMNTYRKDTIEHNARLDEEILELNKTVSALGDELKQKHGLIPWPNYFDSLKHYKYEDERKLLATVFSEEYRNLRSSEKKVPQVQNEIDAFLRRGLNDPGYLGSGYYFTANKQLADEYARIAGRILMPGEKKSPYTYEVYLSIKNPYLPGKTKLPVGFESFYKEKFDAYNIKKRDVDNILSAHAAAWSDALKHFGYDGIIGESAGKEGVEYVVFSPNQIKSATGNRGTFSPDSADIRYSTTTTIAPGVKYQTTINSISDAIQVAPDQLGFLESIQNKYEKLAAWAKDPTARERFWAEFTRKNFDQLAPIKRKIGIKSYQYYKALTGAVGIMDMALRHGQLMMVEKDGYQYLTMKNMSDRGKGLDDFERRVEADIDGGLRTLLYWGAAKSAESLEKQDREKVITKDIRDQIYTAVLGADKTKWAEREKVFKKHFDEYESWNDSFLDIAQASGLISAAERANWKREFYVPFYRIIKTPTLLEEFVRSPKASRKNIAAKIKTLKGGESKIQDPLISVLGNWTHFTKASLQNIARREAFEQDREAMKYFREVSGWKPGDPDATTNLREVYRVTKKTQRADGSMKYEPTDIYFYKHLRTDQNGDLIERLPGDTRPWPDKSRKVRLSPQEIEQVLSFSQAEKADIKDQKVYFVAKDPGLGQALMGPVVVAPGSFFMKAFRGSKRLLTFGATFGGAFKVANWMRDGVHTWLIDPEFKLTDMITGLRKAYSESDEYVALMASGFGFGTSHVRSDDPAALNKYLTSRLGRPDKSYVLHNLSRALTFWERLGHASEMASRTMVFERNLERTGNVMIAGYKARDLLDFTQSGAGTAMQMLIQTVPFLNARIQGGMKLYKTGMEKTTRANMARRGAIIAGASLAVFAAFGDDERYKALQDWEKWTYWNFWIGDEHIRLPKPFELGIVFGTIPETLAQIFAGDERGEYFMKMLGHSITQTMSLSWPQIINPAKDVFYNRSSFTGAPILGAGPSGLSESLQAKPWSSRFLKEMAEQAAKAGIEFSPVKTEYLINGYFSTVGQMVLDGADIVTELLGDYPDKPAKQIKDYPVVGRFARGSGEARRTKYEDRYYDMMKQIDQTARDIKHYEFVGDWGKAQALTIDRWRQQSIAPEARRVGKEARELDRQIQQLWDDPRPSGKDKDNRINDLLRRKHQIYKQFYTNYADTLADT